MSIQLIPINEVLFVFEAWTLMIHSNFTSMLEPGTEAFLFDNKKNKIGKVRLNRFLSSSDVALMSVSEIKG